MATVPKHDHELIGRTFTVTADMTNLCNAGRLGEEIRIVGFNATDSGYFDCLAPDGSCPAISVSKARELARAGRLK